jgi:hypothetical protein
MVHTHNPSTQKAQQKIWEFEDSLTYVGKPCHKKI